MNIVLFPRMVALKMIRVYQKTISPDHGKFSVLHPFGKCKYRPTCSEYAYGSIERYGLVKGGLKAAWRLSRCNPFSKGGYDPVK